MSANNLRILHSNTVTAATAGGVAAPNLLNDYKSQTSSGTTFVLTTAALIGPVAITAMLPEHTDSITMTVTGQTGLTESTTSSTSNLAIGYGGGKYVTKYVRIGEDLTSAVTWNAATNSVVLSNATVTQRAAFLELYTWSGTIPTSFPSGTSTYTWSNGTFTLPATLNGWSLTPTTTAKNQTLWAISVSLYDGTASATSVVTWNSVTAYTTGYTDTSNTVGARVAVLERFRWGTSAPTVYPTGTASTFTWSTAQSTGPGTLNSWTNIPGTSIISNNLYIVRQIYLDVATSFTVTFSSSVKVSRFIIGNYWSPQYNTSYGIELGYEDTSDYERLQSGDIYTTNGPRYKYLSFELSYLTEAEKFTMFDIIKTIGKSKPLFVSIFPEDSDQEKEQMYSIYGKVSDMPALSFVMFSKYTSSIRLEEV